MGFPDINRRYSLRNIQSGYDLRFEAYGGDQEKWRQNQTDTSHSVD